MIYSSLWKDQWNTLKFSIFLNGKQCKPQILYLELYSWIIWGLWTVEKDKEHMASPEIFPVSLADSRPMEPQWLCGLSTQGQCSYRNCTINENIHQHDKPNIALNLYWVNNFSNLEQYLLQLKTIILITIKLVGFQNAYKNIQFHKCIGNFISAVAHLKAKNDCMIFQ